jgi:hypothetical protein
MDISACSPTKFIFSGLESPLAPTKQGPLDDILCTPALRGLTGESELSSDSHLSRTRRPLTSLGAATHIENVVAQGSTFWPGKTVIFKYKQHRNPLQPIVPLD